MESTSEVPANAARRYLARALDEADDDRTRFDIRQALQLLEHYRVDTDLE